MITNEANERCRNAVADHWQQALKCSLQAPFCAGSVQR